MDASLSSNKEVNQFLQSTRPMLIGGNWVESINNDVLEVINPATGRSFAGVHAAGAGEIDRAVTAARTAFESPEWNGMTPTERGQLLWRVADLIEENTDTLAELTTLENGKPYLAAKNGDIPFAAKTFRYYAGWSNKIEGRDTAVISGRKTVSRLYTIRAGWCRGPDSSMEWPGNSGILETGAGPGSRVHFGIQTVRRNTVDRTEAG